MELTNGIDFLKVQLAQKEAECNALKTAIQVLEGTQPEGLPAPRTDEYRDLGITAAAKRFLREMGEPQDTRTIADELIRRGLQTSAKNLIATIYATLNNGKTFFERTTDGRWALKDGHMEHLELVLPGK